MAKTSKYIDINNERFYVVTPTTKEGYIKNLPVRYSNIFEAYGRPSSTKIDIWNWWKTWCEEMGFSIWISSRCTSNFCIGFHGFLNGKEIDGYITKSYNKVVIE